MTVNREKIGENVALYLVLRLLHFTQTFLNRILMKYLYQVYILLPENRLKAYIEHSLILFIRNSFSTFYFEHRLISFLWYLRVRLIASIRSFGFCWYRQRNCDMWGKQNLHHNACRISWPFSSWPLDNCSITNYQGLVPKMTTVGVPLIEMRLQLNIL